MITPGDLVTTAMLSSVVLSKQPVSDGRRGVGLATNREVGLVLARERAVDAAMDMRFPEVLVLFGEKLGWASVNCFQEVK